MRPELRKQPSTSDLKDGLVLVVFIALSLRVVLSGWLEGDKQVELDSPHFSECGVLFSGLCSLQRCMER